MTPRRSQYEAGRHLREDHGCWRDRVEDGQGAGAPAEWIHGVTAGEEQKRDQPQTKHNDPTGRGHVPSVTNR